MNEDKFVPSDPNRVAIKGSLPQTEPRYYLPRSRLDEMRERAEGYAVNNGGALAMRPGDLIAMVDELVARRATVTPVRLTWRQRLASWIIGRSL